MLAVAQGCAAELVIASGAEQSRAALLDCFVAALLAMTAGEYAPAASPECLDPGLRQPANGPVERDLSRAPPGLHHHRAGAAGDRARRDRRDRRGDRELRQARLGAAVGPQPQAQAVGDRRL